MRLGTAPNSVSSGSGLGLSHRELSNGLLHTHRLVASPLHSRAQGLPPPPPLVGDAGGTAHGCAPKVSGVPSFLSSTPCSDSWHRVGWNFAHASIHTYRLVALGHCLYSLLARPFVCGCHTIVTIPSIWTIPGLPGSPTPLPHRVARTHRGTMRGNPCAFASIVQARPFPIFGRPVHPRRAPVDYGPMVLRKPFRFHLAVDTLPSGTPHRWLQVPLGSIQLSPACPCRGLHTFLSSGQ